MGKKEDNIKKLETIFREKINPDIRLSTNQWGDIVISAKIRNYMVKAIYYAIDDIQLLLLEEQRPFGSNIYHRKYTTNTKLSEVENIINNISILTKKDEIFKMMCENIKSEEAKELNNQTVVNENNIEKENVEDINNKKVSITDRLNLNPFDDDSDNYAYKYKLMDYIKESLKTSLKFLIAYSIIDDIDISVVISTEDITEDPLTFLIQKYLTFNVKFIDINNITNSIGCCATISFPKDVADYYETMHMTNNISENILRINFYNANFDTRIVVDEPIFCIAIEDFVSLSHEIGYKNSYIFKEKTPLFNLYKRCVEEATPRSTYYKHLLEESQIKDLKDFFDNFIEKMNTLKVDNELLDSINLDKNYEYNQEKAISKAIPGATKLTTKVKNNNIEKELDFIFYFNDDNCFYYGFTKSNALSDVDLLVGDKKSDRYTCFTKKLCYNLADNILFDNETHLFAIKTMINNVLEETNDPFSPYTPNYFYRSIMF